MPIFNGSTYLRNRLDGILNQTFRDFELLISDNASTDTTQLICEEYAKKDSRIKYVRQQKNRGSTWNFYYVLNHATSEYFVWVAVDDIWQETFLEKNIVALDSNKNFVGSTSKIDLYGPIFESLKSTDDDGLFQKTYKKIWRSFRYMNTKSIYGTYEKRVREYLKNPGHNSLFFSVFRTNKLKKCIVEDAFPGTDFAIVLSILRYGDLNALDEILMYKFEGGMSGKGMKKLLSEQEFQGSLLSVILPHYPFTHWCIKNLGRGIIFQNIDCLIKINLEGIFALFISALRKK